MATDVARPSAEDVEPVSNETVARVSTGLVTVLPVLALGLCAWQLWGSALGNIDYPRKPQSKQGVVTEPCVDPGP